MRHGLAPDPVPEVEPHGATCLITRPFGPVTAGKVQLVDDLGAAGKVSSGGLLIDVSAGRASTAGDVA